VAVLALAEPQAVVLALGAVVQAEAVVLVGAVVQAEAVVLVGAAEAVGASRNSKQKNPRGFDARGFWFSLNSGRHSEPVVHFLADLILGIPVAILDLSFQLIAAPVDRREVVIGEFAPLLLDPTRELLPVTFDAIPVHIFSSPRCL
jgi:hypothetical protein